MSSEAKPSGKPFIRPVRSTDVLELAYTMRKEDREELFHSDRWSPIEALDRGMAASVHTGTIQWGGRVVAMFGVVRFPGQPLGIPWMLGTDDLKRCRSLLRQCRSVLQSWLEEFGLLANSVWSQNTVHIEWLKWLGFTFEGSTVKNGETFLYFHQELPPQCVPMTWASAST